ncbi:MAG: STAS-like domain-containing protein [Planctomycetota bacterium]
MADFAENKDVARELRRTVIAPAVKAGKVVELDFVGVGIATQSFIHALLGEVIREQPGKALKLLTFRNCSPAVKSTITLVAEYMQDTNVAPVARREEVTAAAGKARSTPRRTRRPRKK